ncbi:MAG TPA: SUMF1/EgtB/PvdO family nonheme iron enzyme, partial [Polyangiaceae bacterium]|nr:SUMF1/EgtB/PvdO family nonheme iron enzyme [Polyangiaceae bacterium]
MADGSTHSGKSRSFVRAFVLGAGLGLLVAVGMWWSRRPRPAPRVMPTTTSSAQPRPVDGGASDAAADAQTAETPYVELDGGTLEEQKQALLENLVSVHHLTNAQAAEVRRIFESSQAIGQGNPEITVHPMSRAECRRIRGESERPIVAGDARCGGPYMVPLYDPTRGESAEQAKVCIDQYEFPDIPCEYPLVYARANEAAELCKASGKRLCDAHEWEGACAGALKPPEQEYAFGERRMMQEYLHNKEREIVWAYGTKKDHSKCATGSRKSPKCSAGGWQECGSNTYPAGAFPECVSSLGVYDQHGNAAEHMNLPLAPEELGSRGGSGETEMKGSWFIFAHGEAHEDDCR